MVERKSLEVRRFFGKYGNCKYKSYKLFYDTKFISKNMFYLGYHLLGYDNQRQFSCDFGYYTRTQKTQESFAFFEHDIYTQFSYDFGYYTRVNENSIFPNRYLLKHYFYSIPTRASFLLKFSHKIFPFLTTIATVLLLLWPVEHFMIIHWPFSSMGHWVRCECSSFCVCEFF